MAKRPSISELGRHSLRHADTVAKARTQTKLRSIKEKVLSLSNEINAKHGHFRASVAGKPTLVYGEGHDMKKHGEGQSHKTASHDEIERQLAEHFENDKD